MSKPRSDSKLDPLREEIFPRMKAGESYNALALWLLTEHGVDTSAAALSNAWKKWSRDDLEERVMKSRTGADDILELIDNPEQLDEAIELGLKQATFEAIISQGDPKSVKNLCMILMKINTLKLDQRKVELQERRLKQAEEAEGVVKDETLTPEDREKRMKEIFGL
jgi:hypothetical protein